MSIPCDKTFLLVPSSRSSVKVKVKYQGHSFRTKMAVAGALAFHKHILFLHVFQSARSDKFQKFDYGLIGNLKKYGKVSQYDSSPASHAGIFP